MAQVMVHSTRFSALADLASAYSLAFVLKLYSPSLGFASFIPDPLTAQAVEVIVIGTFISSFLLSVDPVNKVIRLRLRWLLTRDKAPKKAWAVATLAHLKIPTVSEGLREGYYVSKAGAAYYAPYLAKLRAQMTAGTIFSVTMLALVFQVKSSVTELVLLLLAFITAYSVWRDVTWKVPAYSWIVAVYEILVEFKPRADIPELDLITKHLSDENWEEARSWLQYYIANAPVAGKT